MIFRRLFKKKQKDKGSAIRQLIDGEALDPENPFVIYIATEIVSDFGEILEQTSRFVWGVSEKRLPYSKEEIQKAIELIFIFYQNEESWDRFKKSYPEISELIFTNKYYGALRCGYLELAKFINEDDAQVCEKAIRVISKAKLSEDDIKKLKSLGLQRAVEVNKRIATETSSRLRELQEKYGVQDIHPSLD